MKRNVTRFASKTVAIGALTLLYTGMAFASTSGGLTTATSTATEIKTGLYSLVGVLALIYLLWVGVQAFTEKKSWADFGWAVVHVAAVGAATTLGTWAWSLFAS